MTRYLSLAEFWFLAEQVTGIDAATLIKASRVWCCSSILMTADGEQISLA